MAPAASRPRRAADVLLLAGAAGLATGCAYAAIVVFTDRVLGRLTFHSPDVIWMAPLGSAVVFVLLALPLALAALLTGWTRWPVLAAGLFGFLGAFNLLAPYGGLARWAMLLLALGAAVQLARRWARDPDRGRRAAVRALVVLAAVALGLGLGSAGFGALRGRAARNGLPAAPPGAPNILLLIWDTVRAEDLSLYGDPRATTPALARWAGSGVVFEQAFSTAPWTLPSHGSLFTGEPGSALGGGWVRPVRWTGPTLAGALQARGYRTGGFVANLLYTSRESGLTGGFTDYRDYPRSWAQVWLHVPLLQTGLARSLARARSAYAVKAALRGFDLDADRVPADQPIPARAISDGFLAWQAGLGARPFFAFLNYFDAHEPYRSPPGYLDRFTTPGTASTPRDRYAAAIAHLDAELDRILEALAARGVLDRTIVVVSSDHGELFGEHGLTGHANALFLPVLRVPLVIRYPGRLPAGVRVAAPVSLRDLPATLLELAGATEGPLPGGRSLRWSWTGGTGHPVVATVTRARYRGDPNFVNAETWLATVLDARWQYILTGSGAESLYDWRSDPAEHENLAAVPEHRETLARLRASLDSSGVIRSLAAASGAPRP